MDPSGARRRTWATGLNTADNDVTDRVLQVYALDAGGNSASPAPCMPAGGATCTAGVRKAAKEFVVGDLAATACGSVQLIAFRTRESAEGNRNLNATSNGQPTGDTDANDSVLHVYEAVSGTLVNTGQAVTPCRLEACDPRRPYRAEGSKVTFLTFEPDQGGRDLSGEGNTGDLVLQAYDFCGAVPPAPTGPAAFGRAASEPSIGVVTTIGRVFDGRNHDPLDVSAESQAFSSPAGRCDAGVTCNAGTVGETCSEGAFCEPDRCQGSVCVVHRSVSCVTDADCARCILRQPPTCLADADCPAGSTCEAQVITAVSGVADDDVDGVPNDLDNCPQDANPNQFDVDGDGVGDACDSAVQCTSVSDPDAVVKVKAKNDAGKLTAKLKLPLASYDDVPISVSLVDGDGTIASQDIGRVPPKGNSGKKWLLKIATDIGVTKVQLKNLAPNAPGTFQVKVKAKGWFTAAAANQSAANTQLLITIGGQCFSHAATKKVD